DSEPRECILEVAGGDRLGAGHVPARTHCRNRWRAGTRQSVVGHPPLRTRFRSPMSDNALGLRQSMLLALQLARKNRSLFIDARDDPMRRRFAFDVVEKNCRERFAEGEDGVRLYLQLLGYVQSAKVDKAVEEFERRFEPMLN